MSTRRMFLRTSAISAIGAFVLRSPRDIFAQSVSDVVFEETVAAGTWLNSKAYPPFLTTEFRVLNQKTRQVAALRLLQVKPHVFKSNTELGLLGESFSLLFEKVSPRPLEQGIYTFAHDALGEHQFYVGPVLADPNLYEVLVNRITR